ARADSGGVTVSPGSSPARFRVTFNELLRQRVREYTQRAHDSGFGQRFLAEMQEIVERMATDPLNWGDPIYTLHSLGLQMFHRIHSGIHVEYGVNEPARVVFVRRVEPTTGHPLAEEGRGG